MLRNISSLLLAILFFIPASRAQISVSPQKPRITAVIDSNVRTVLRGNVDPLTARAVDLGPAPASQAMLRMLLVLHRSETEQAALDQFTADQQNASSLSYHHWLTPAEFGMRFGVADADVTTITAWLVSQGFDNISVNNGRTFVEFSGTVDTVGRAFSTPIHRFRWNGATLTANTADPSIPAALAPVVTGIASLNSFPRRHFSHIAGVFHRDPKSAAATPVPGKTPSSLAAPLYTGTELGQTFYGLGPADWATIYNVLPLWNAVAPVDGSGQNIAIVGETDIDPTDFVAFRQIFGLPLGNTSGPTGTQYLNIIQNGADPGILQDGEETEADLDTQWSSAIAKGATIDFVVSASTETTAGIDLSAEYIIDNNIAPVMSTSYGACEHALGTAGNAFYDMLYQQAAAEGITVLSSSGDDGSAGCDVAADGQIASDGLNVSGMTSTPYDTSVGGTDFYMPGNAANYWSSSSNPTTGASALSYIPEMVWNDSCANPVLSQTSVFSGMSPVQVCNDPASPSWSQLINDVAGSGGKSSCTQSTGTLSSACSSPYPKPAWQNGRGVPADNVRDVPDLSFFAGNNSAFYVVCERDYAGVCALDNFDFVGVGGTSASAPAFAGVMALINQETGSRQGNANNMLYKLAAAQPATGCDSASGSGAACVFNDVTLGGNLVPCELQSPDCNAPSGSVFYGVINGYTAGAGYDLASGLGSANIANLVHAWSSTALNATSTTLQLSPTTFVHGSATTANITVTSSAGTPTGLVSLLGTAVDSNLQAGTLTNGSLSQPVNALPGGSYNITAHYAGDGTFGSSDSVPVSVTVAPETGVDTLLIETYDNITGATANVSSAPYGSQFIIRSNVGGVSGVGIATGNVTLKDDGSLLDGGVFIINNESAAEDFTTGFSSGAHTITSIYAGDASFGPSSASGTLTITPTPMICTAFVNTDVLRPGWQLIYSLVTAQASPNHTSEPEYIANGNMAVPTGTFSLAEGSTLVAGPVGPSPYSTGGAPPVCSGYACNLTVPTVGAVSSLSIAASSLQQPLQPFTASYSGDSNYGACSTPPVTVTWETGPVNVSINGTINPYQNQYAVGTPVSIALSLTYAGILPSGEPAFPAATGSLQAYIDGNAVGAVIPLNAQGAATASVPTTGLTSGYHDITFKYPGDATYNPATSGTYSVDIVSPDFAFPSSASFNTTNGSSTAAQTIQISSIGGFTGSVALSCGTLPRGVTCNFNPASVPAGSSFTLSFGTTQAAISRGTQTASLLRKPYARGATRSWPEFAGVLMLLSIAFRKRVRIYRLTIVALFSATLLMTSCGGGERGSTGSSPSQPIATYLSLTSSNSAPVENTPVTLTASLSATGSTVPTGSMSFVIDGGTPATVAVTGDTTTWNTSFTRGSHYITATYSGDDNFLASSAALNISASYASGTPPGYYTIIVTGASGSLIHTMPVYLNVQ